MSKAAAGLAGLSSWGRCLCGAVQYEVRGPLRPVVACHCEMCRRTSGHFVAATAARRRHLILHEDRGLRWFDSSAEARRGFCQHCGGNLFWERKGGPNVSIMAGTLDKPTGLAIAAHIFVADAGDYYRADDGTPQHVDGEHGVAMPGESPPGRDS
ncbi:MAG: GFA family protein [Dongiaceae bacterium]